MQSEQDKDAGSQQQFVDERGNVFLHAIGHVTGRLVRDWNRQLRDIAHLFGMSDDRSRLPVHTVVARKDTQSSEPQDTELPLRHRDEVPVANAVVEPVRKIATPALPQPEQKKSKLILPPLPEKGLEESRQSTLSGLSVTDSGEEKASRLLPLPPLPERKPESDSGITEFKPNVRTRLADPESIEIEKQAEAQRAQANSKLGPYGAFYLKCPACKSEEVYAMNSDGAFTRFPCDLAWFCQRLFCERCTQIFHRPGRLFLAPRPVIRPADTALYDG